MHRKILTPLAVPIAAMLGAVAVMAQADPPKSYEVVAIAPPAASADESFVAFRATFAATVNGAVYANLAALVHPENFFWGRDFDNRFDPNKPPVENLATAVQLERHDGIGWRRLARFAAEPSIEPLVSRPGVFCAPAQPGYDNVAFTRLLIATYSVAGDWVYPRGKSAPVRGAPEPHSTEIGVLGQHFARLLGTERAAGDNSPDAEPWPRVATPDGKVGFVMPDSVNPLDAEQLCYFKDVVGRWRITGYIAKRSQ